MKTDLLFSSFPFIGSDKVTLSKITEMDVNSLYRIMSDHDNFMYSPFGAIETRDVAELRIGRMASNFKEKKAIDLGIFLNSELNKLIGTLTISKVNPRTESITLDFLIHREYTGRGLGTSAVKAAVKYLFERINANRIQVYSMPNNYRCEALLKKCGFVKEGTIREGFYWPDKGIVDLSIYSILQSDYQRGLHKGEQRTHMF